MSTTSPDPFAYNLTATLAPPDLTLRMSGELDFSTELGLTAFDEVDLDGVHSILLDLSALMFIDVAGVRALRAWCDAHTGQQRVVTMVGAPSSVRRLFQLLDSERYLTAA